MNFRPKKGLVLVDALLGMILLGGVVLFCSYSKAIVALFTATSADVRELIAWYRQSSLPNNNQAEIQSIKIALFQQECCIAAYEHEIIVIQDKRWQHWPLIKIRE